MNSYHNRYRVPKLHAYVKYENDEHIMGYLLGYINHQDTLAGRGAEAATTALRRNWYRSGVHTLSALHDASIIWEDAKADNALLDYKNDAWMIDFGESFTEGRIDQDETETVAGDLQGLYRIRESLRLR